MVIFIVTMGLLGLMSLVIQNVQVEYVNKNMLIASQLAQEGLELVRDKRDNNWLASSSDWELGDGMDPNTDIIQDGDYAIDYTNLGLINVDDIEDTGARLYIDSDGYYRHFSAPLPGATSTPFSRMIIADTDTSNASTTFQCLVQWKARNNTYQYTAETVLYNWLPIP